MRGLRTTIGLIVVLGGLFAYIYFVTWKQPAETPGPKQEKVFATLEADKIEELRSSPSRATPARSRKTRTAGTWPNRSPPRHRTRRSPVSRLRSRSSRWCVSWTRKPANLNDYGLASPRIEIDFKAAGDKDFRSLLIGQKSPTGGNLFAKRKGDEKVFLIAAFQEQTFNRRTFDLRDKAALHFDRDKVDRIAIDAGRQGARACEIRQRLEPDEATQDGIRLLRRRRPHRPADVRSDEVHRVRQRVPGRSQEVRARQAGGHGHRWASGAPRPLCTSAENPPTDRCTRGMPRSRSS